jgi:4-diphosphocytidyl-2-C-methyl-D-erythritol kinase
LTSREPVLIYPHPARTPTVDNADKLVIYAPAKVNLTLRVVGKRPDGYHNLEMLMVPVSLFDKLTLEPTKTPGQIEVSCEGSKDVPDGEGNICFRAARYYFEQAKIEGGVRIHIEKNTPSGAGMGGGSSNGAATIMGLERLYGEKLSAEARSKAAFEVGADVPFFFAQGPACVGGIGETVQPVAFEERLWMVVVHPGVFLSTPAVFSNLKIGLTTPQLVHTIMQFNFRGIAKGLFNDLELPARNLEPVIGQAITALEDAGSTVAAMTGSGSAAFGLFPDESSARSAALALAALTPGGWRVEAVHTLSDASDYPK